MKKNSFVDTSSRVASKVGIRDIPKGLPYRIHVTLERDNKQY